MGSVHRTARRLAVRLVTVIAPCLTREEERLDVYREFLPIIREELARSRRPFTPKKKRLGRER